ncbi:hypothetical protein Gpo141_00004280 [Globisporangium polare]
MGVLRIASAVLAVAAVLSSGAFAQEDAALTAAAPMARNSTSSGSSSSSEPNADAGAAAPAPVVTSTSAPTLAPIASASPGSSTFQYVSNAICSEDVVSKINLIYAKNRNMFDECVGDADYQIFPHSGQDPTTQQIRAMATSRSCVAIFTAVVLAGFPACDIGGMPMKAVTETLLKIKIDIDEGREAASAQRFQELMYWRRDVDLAQAAGVPFDSDSALYNEYKVNLWKALNVTTVRVSSDFTLEYELSNGTYTRGKLSFSTLDDGSGSSSSKGGVVGSVRPAGSSDGIKSSGSSQDVIKVNVSSSAPASLMQKRTTTAPGIVATSAVALVVATALAVTTFV